MGNRAGYFRTNLWGEAAYKSFVPSPLPPAPAIEMDNSLWQQVVSAHRKIAELETRSSRIPDLPMFLSMYVRKEALMSAQIEGTQATLEDVLDPFIEENTNLDVADVIQYVAAMQYAIEALKVLPLCGRLLRDTHKVLLSGVRGKERDPGTFRRSQNWIGAPGSTLSNARYIPPSVEDLPDAMSALERYMNAEPDIDPLVSAALIHYQFETIHPFLDGNGRLGRLIIVLYLMQQKLLSSPTLYVSYFLKQYRTEYYDRLAEVRRTGNYEQWISFFVQAIDTAAGDAASTITDLETLHEQSSQRIMHSTGRSASRNVQLLQYLEHSPIIEVNKTAEAMEMSYPTANSAVKSLVDIGILEQMTDARRNRVFVYRQYVDILKRGTENI